MRDVVVRFDSICKQYQLRRSLARQALFLDPKTKDSFYALKDVSFEIERGEAIGLIGPNGAGKSTILKILARVTVPSSGRYQVQGRLGALIEVGAGFHPQLTGRENVYLNGAIMGMRKREIDAKFDQIVEFSEVEKFLDTPLKFYSSGMTVRLGFAVAAHINPDVLLVDEVLAVGDTAFQAKCLNKIAELRDQDRTIILVSHAMPSILRHSSKVLWIDHGTIQGFGDPDETVEAYLRTVHSGVKPPAPTPAENERRAIRIMGVTLRNGSGEPTDVLDYGAPATLDIHYSVSSAIEDPVVGITIHDVRDLPLAGITSRFGGVEMSGAVGDHVARVMLSPVLLTRGSYGITVAIQDSRIQRYLDLRSRAVTFMVNGPSVASREISGSFVFPHHWESDPGAAGAAHGKPIEPSLRRLA